MPYKQQDNPQLCCWVRKPYKEKSFAAFGFFGMRAIFYVDGFNLYNSRLKKLRQFRWLDIFALGKALASEGHVLSHVNFYTAYVSGKIDPLAVGKQQAYLAALKTNPDINIHAGNFSINNKWVKLLHPPDARPQGYQWHEPYPEFVMASIPQEKGSDVKLAAHLVRDGYRGDYDVAYVLTNDTDLIEPIRIVTQELGLEVVLVPRILPRSPKNPVPPKALKAVSSGFKLIEDEMLAACLLPQQVIKPNGSVLTCPQDWSESPES
ncbi:NYN domain-containing protein [Martelella radicis]|uniref:Uncharacterized LabA/DUF88 family protein n=1 Tax=Martelella radicis TaxID=1397476 RepID=A0A7W6KLA2_9HYPH|nr:NYN domain-containing protein [Martelella radicis]MBB4123135.1 uncharacterized LabA/DUF88 family protein [Martelella radicis]